MPDLREIIDLLDETTIAQEIGLKHYAARERFQGKVLIGNYVEFQQEVTRAYQYFFSQTIADTELPESYAWSAARQIVESKFGSLETAVRNCMTGRAGALHSVYNALNEALLEEMTEKYIRHILSTYVNPMSWSDRLDLMNQYISRYGAYLEGAKQPEALVADWEKLIRLHAQVVSRIRGEMSSF